MLSCIFICCASAAELYVVNVLSVRSWTFKSFSFKAAAVWASPDHSLFQFYCWKVSTGFLPQEFYDPLLRFGAISWLWLKGRGPTVYQLIADGDINTTGGFLSI
ncbi:hypothetical protein AMECASPLE_039576 [Ameca splendens]|uniref:Secreted protein n=1 Tax=Ameca splendens TaxID=208324 RepID=A0ABV0ZJB9_9TELE